jgi:crotonobetainyl-CoA:carnitine CoA-transferase CaiB-like acyl-CoA transferase
MAGALNGLRVLDLTSVLMGPFATQLMADIPCMPRHDVDSLLQDPHRVWATAPRCCAKRA